MSLIHDANRRGLVTCDQAAQLAGVDTWWLWERICAGDVPWVASDRGKVFVTLSGVRELLKPTTDNG